MAEVNCPTAGPLALGRYPPRSPALQAGPGKPLGLRPEHRVELAHWMSRMRFEQR